LSSSRQSSLWKQGAIWGSVLWLTHMSMLTPLLSLTVWLASIPAVVLYVKTNRQVFGGIAVASLASGAILSGPFAFGFLCIAIAMLLPAVAIGEAYRRGLTIRKVLTTGVISYLAVFLGSMLLATGLGVNLNQTIRATVQDGIALFPESMKELFTDEVLSDFISLMVMMIPFYFIATAVTLTMVTHAVSRRICNKTGSRLPGLPPLRDWKMPRAFVWYYLIALFADLLVPRDDRSFMAAIVVNIVPLFMSLFAMQGIAFLFFIAYIKRKAWIPWIGIVGVIFITPLFSAFSLLGVFDTAFPIRDRFRKS
jgi:uncharacterized protein YybS (DUF2232 family)